MHVDDDQGYKRVLSVITKKLRMPSSSAYKLYNISKTEYCGDHQGQQVELHCKCFVLVIIVSL